MDNRHDMQYFSSAAVLEMLKRVVKMKDDLTLVAEIMVEEDPTFAEDMKTALAHVNHVKSLLLKGNELIHYEQEGWLALVNGNIKGQPHPIFYDEVALGDKATEGYSEGYESASKEKEALAQESLKEAYDRIEALEDELQQLRK